MSLHIFGSPGQFFQILLLGEALNWLRLVPDSALFFFFFFLQKAT